MPQANTFLFLLMLPLAGLLVASGCQTGGAQPAPGQQDAAGQRVADSDSLTLINQADAALVYLAFNPRWGRPLKMQMEVDLDNPPPEFVPQDSSAALWDCDALEDYEGFTLHLYRVEPPADGGSDATAYLAESIEMTTDRFAALRGDGCRLEVEELAQSR